MARQWTCYKFGGSSVKTPELITQVTKLTVDGDFTKIRRALVVSAFGGVTNELVAAIDLAVAGNDTYKDKLEEVIKRHSKAIIDLFQNHTDRALHHLSRLNKDRDDISALLYACKISRSCAKSIWDVICGHGEIWSSRIIFDYMSEVQKKLRVEYLDARDVIISEDVPFGGKEILWDLSQEKMNSWINGKGKSSDCDVVVIPGFIASTKEGLSCTLNRNSSDFSAAIIAKLMKTIDCVIWTDVDGVYSAHPKFVTNAVLLEALSYKEALELAYFGARVLHPLAIAPCMENNIPMYIRNTFNVQCPGTKIDGSVNTNGAGGPKGLSTIDGIALVNLEGSGMIGIPGTAARVFVTLRDVAVNAVIITQGSSEQSICIGVNEKDAEISKKVLDKQFYHELEHNIIQEISIIKGCTVMAVVGDSMVHHPGVAGKVCEALGRSGVNILAIAQGSSERNISLVIKTQDEKKALQSVHAAFYGSPLGPVAFAIPRVSIALVGAGNVGSCLLSQIHAYNQRNKNAPIAVKIISTSTKMIISDSLQGIDLSKWKEILSSEGIPADLGKVSEFMVRAKSIASVAVVDCTTSEKVTQKYTQWISLGLSVVAANKKLFSGPIEDYKLLKDTLQKITSTNFKEAPQLFHETTVGAALPVINTLKTLVETGDEIYSIEGVLSGTLSFVFNQFQTGKDKFSDIVKKAKELGYTEPDPRDDLGGKDFARKLVILGREAGVSISLDDVAIASLVESELENVSVDEYLAKLPKFDEKMAKLRETAAASGSVLRFVGTVDVTNKKAKLELQSVPLSHPLAALSGAENIISFKTRRYNTSPLVVRGPGAGPEITASGVLGDILQIRV